MNFSQEIDAIKTAIYSDARVKSLFCSYLLCQKESRLNPWEDHYEEGKTVLPKLLTDAQQRKLSDIEGGYRYNLHSALRFSFPRGLCAVFQQYYTDNTGENAFQDWIEERLRTEPLVKFQRGILNHQNQCADFLSKLEEEADEAAKEYIRNIKNVWDDRIYGMLRYGFYLGYRCGLSALTEDDPARKMERMEKKVLLTEFELELTNTRWTQETLDEVKDGLNR